MVLPARAVISLPRAFPSPIAKQTAEPTYSPSFTTPTRPWPTACNTQHGKSEETAEPKGNRVEQLAAAGRKLKKGLGDAAKKQAKKMAGGRKKQAASAYEGQVELTEEPPPPKSSRKGGIEESDGVGSPLAAATEGEDRILAQEANLRNAIANVEGGETVAYNSAICASVGPGGSGKVSNRTLHSALLPNFPAYRN